MCLSVTCTAGDFAACRGDVALTCNAMGNNYDELQCQKGCTPEAKGCRLCDAGQTVCANGEVQTCDANGAVSSSDTCAFGCFNSEPRCRTIDPSNNLAQYIDMVPSPPDFDTGASSVAINTGTGTVNVGGTVMTLPSFLVAAPTGGVSVRVFVVHNFHVAANESLYTSDSTSSDGGYTSAALAIVATGDITVDGTITPYTGASLDPACLGGHGDETDNGNRFQTGASGGGGFATAGGTGAGIIAPGLGGGTAGGR